MEFKYRAVDERRTMFTPQNSNNGYFAEQSLRGYSPSPAGPGYGRPATYYQNPRDMREAVWRELEKEKIREEIIAAEIARRHMLEAEVRRELMIEGELAIHRGVDGFYFPPRPNMPRFNPRGLPAPPFHNQAEGRPFEGRITFSLEERLGMSAMVRREIGAFDSTTFQPQRSLEPRISEVPATEISSQKEKIVVMARPELSLSGVKRIAETSVRADSSDLLPSAGSLKKKVRVELSCAICQVSATSEQALSEHLQGKKHKAKEAGLRNNGKNFSIGLYPKNSAKPNKPADIANNPNSELNLKGTERNCVHPAAKDQQPYNLLKNNEATVQRMQKNKERRIKKKEKKKKKFIFRCEMCKVRVFSEQAMEAHRTGKKHIALLQDVNKHIKAEPSSQVVQATQELNLAGEPGKDEGNTVCKHEDCIVDEVNLDSQREVAHGDAVLS